MCLTADDHRTIDLRNRFSCNLIEVHLQIQVAAHVRQLKTFICNLLLEYVGSKVSAQKSSVGSSGGTKTPCARAIYNSLHMLHTSRW
jgi:hypothetical protein